MQMIKLRFAALLLIVASLSLSCTAKHSRSKEWVQLRVEPLESSVGWGYEIFAGEKLYIKQDKIPVVGGSQGFKTKQQAVEAGQMVIDKLKKGQSPALDSDDLRKVSVQF